MINQLLRLQCFFLLLLLPWSWRTDSCYRGNYVGSRRLWSYAVVIISINKMSVASPAREREPPARGYAETVVIVVRDLTSRVPATRRQPLDVLLLLLGSSLDAVKRNAAETFGRLAAANGNCVRTDDQVDLLLLLAATRRRKQSSTVSLPAPSRAVVDPGFTHASHPAVAR
jgi:hypothetical protein